MAEVKNKRVSLLIEEEPAWIPTKEDFDNKLDTLTVSADGYAYAYALDQNRKEKLLKIFAGESATPSDWYNTLVARSPSGKIICSDPTNPIHVATKGYVDDHLSGLLLPALPSDTGNYLLRLAVDATAGTVTLSWVAETEDE